MRLCKGWWVPDYDANMEANITNAPSFAGRASYQLVFFLAALPHVKDFRHALDIGAHVGLWTHMLSQCFEGVTAFEPIEEHQDCWHRNHIESRKAGLFRMALGDRECEIEMAIKPPVSLKARVRTNEPAQDTRKVLMRRLDDVMSNASGIDFVKIDCEGYERHVLVGGEQTIRRNKPLMFVEQKPGNVSRYGNADAVALLKDWGAQVKFEMGGDWCLGWP